MPVEVVVGILVDIDFDTDIVFALDADAEPARERSAAGLGGLRSVVPPVELHAGLWPLTEIAMPLLTETWPPRIRVRGARHRDQHRKAGGPLFVSTTLAISVSGEIRR